MCTHAHMDSKSAVAEARHTTSNTGTRGSSRTHKDTQHDRRHRNSKRGTTTSLAKVAFLLCGAWVDDISSGNSRRGTIRELVLTCTERKIHHERHGNASTTTRFRYILRPGARNFKDLTHVSHHKIRNEAQPHGNIFKHVTMHP